MSGHADTIRRFIKAGVGTPGHQDRLEAATALDALVAENQHLRGALTKILHNLPATTIWARSIARAALAGTPSEDTE